MTSLKIDKVNIEVSKGRIRLRWTYQGQRFSLSIGEENQHNLDFAKSKAYQINSDILKGTFAFDSYKPKKAEDMPKELTLLDLWDIYLKMKLKSGLKLKTIEWLLEVDKKIKRLGGDLTFDAFTVSEKLLDFTTVYQTRIALIQLSACCKYAIKRGLISENKFKGVWEYLPDQETNAPYCFSKDETAKILKNFANHKDYCFYYDLVVFWLNTGCRPSEALGVRWCDVDPGFGHITFKGSPQRINGKGIVWSKGSKTYKKGGKRSPTRVVPLNSTLRECLTQRYSSQNPKDNDLIFPNHENRYIDYRKVSGVIWKKLVKSIPGLEKTTPYNLRDTFITNQLLKGVPIAVIAAWCDNSPTMIQSRYADYVRLAIAAIVPECF